MPHFQCVCVCVCVCGGMGGGGGGWGGGDAYSITAVRTYVPYVTQKVSVR